MSLTREQILASNDTKLMERDVPEWGGSVFIRIMSVGERDAYENEWSLSKHKGMPDFRTKFLVKCLCDKDGNRLFTEADIAVLREKSADLMSALWDDAMKYNRLRGDSVEEAGKN